jgi:hypothetical protein
MASQTRAELGDIFERNLDIFERNLNEGGLDEFEPEPEAERSAVDLPRWEPSIARPTPTMRSWPLAVPVVIAAAIGGAAVSWLGLRASETPGGPSPSPSAASESVLVDASESAVVDAPPVVPVAPEPVVEAAAVPATVLAPPAPAPAVPAPVNPALEATLAAVSRSYRDLDPAALASVWPGADTASLKQSFKALKYQTLSFERCETRENGPVGVLASCDVSIAAASKSGDPALRRRRELWTLVLARSGDRWTISGVSVRAGVVSAAAIP